MSERRRMGMRLELAARRNNAAFRCSNVHDDDEKIIVYVRGLIPALTNILQRLRSETPC